MKAFFNRHNSILPFNKDMVSFDEKTLVQDVVTEERYCFHEGSSIRKIGDTYYYVYADVERGKPTALGYSTSKSPLGPFAYCGIIIANANGDPESWNNHGSIECFKGQRYVFYHLPKVALSQYLFLFLSDKNIVWLKNRPDHK